MKKRIRKAVLLVLKLAVAAGLLAFVLSKVHWNDYAVTTGGADVRVYAIDASPGQPERLQVKEPATGQIVWKPVRDFRPFCLQWEGRWVSVLDAKPSWEMPSQYKIRKPEGEMWVEAAQVNDQTGEYWELGFKSALLSAKPWLLVLSAVCFVLPNLIMSVRWWYLLRIQEIRIPWWEAVRLTFLGQFFSYIVPGTVSGDLVKAWYVAKHTPRKAAVLVSVFIDRVVGLLEFAILPAVVMACMLAAGVGGMGRFRWPAIMVAVVLLAVAVTMSLLLSPELRRVLHLGTIRRRLPLQKHLAMLADAANLYRRRAGALFKALAITFGGQFFFIGAILLAGRSLGLPVPWYQYFLYVPLIYIIAAVPISPGGLGVTEICYVLFFTPSGSDSWQASGSQILALALVVRLLPMLVSLPGLVVALRGPHLPKAEEMQAELEGVQDKPAKS